MHPTTSFHPQLSVEGHKSVLSSLREYVADARLDGSNQYQMPDSKESVDAVKHTLFTVFPPVLHLHLMRFTYSSITGVKEKINSVSVQFGEAVQRNQNPAPYCSFFYFIAELRVP